MKSRNRKSTLVTMLVVTLMIVMLLSSGCNSVADNSVEEGNAATENVGFEDRELIVATPEANNDFDPYDDYGYNDYGFYQVYDSLVIKNGNGEIVPSLAESFETSPDGKMYTFKIREGVIFSDGNELKASDILFSFEKATTSPYTTYMLLEYESCSIVDEYTVEVVLNAPSASFLQKLSTYLRVVSESAYSEYGDQYGKSLESVVGTGPYILKEWKPSELCVFEANPNYFRGEADIKKLRFKTITDVNAAVIALQTKEVDLYLMAVPGLSITDIEANEELTLTKFPSTILMYSIMNCESGPFSDVRMRQAVAYGVDQNKALIVGTEGEGTLVDSPAGWDYTGNPGEETWYYEQDLEKAKALVKEAGMEGETIVLKTYATDPYPKIATSVQSDLNKIGLNVEVLQMERNAFIEDVLANGDYEIAVCRFSSGTKDMDEVMTAHLSTTNIGISGNWSRYSNPEVDIMLEEARSLSDVGEREKLYAEIIQIYTDEAVEIPMYYTLGNMAYTSDISADVGRVEFATMFDFKWND
jgi:peptide/nickel transport system substrate-binding protein